MTEIEPLSTATPAEPATVRVRARVASHSPGRLRVRVHAASRQSPSMDAIGQRITSALGPSKVEVSAATGSVLVHYDHQTHSSTDVMRILRDVGVAIEETARGVGLDLPEMEASTTSSRIVDAMGDLDRQLSALTGRKVDLKLLFPLTLGGLGLWRVATAGLGLDQVPAYVLLWYAFDSFWKFHGPPAKLSADGQNGTRSVDGDGGA